jgi:O-antigen/teichoic acid export membrane protein
VTAYSVTSRLAVLASQSLASKLPNAAMPGAAELFAAGRLEALRPVFLRLTAYAVRLAVTSAAFIALANRQFVELWVGPEHYAGPWLGAVFVYWALQDSLHRGICGILFATGRIHGWTLASAVEAALNLGLSLALVGPLGLFGVALATSVARTATTAWFAPLAICRALDLGVARFLIDGVAATALRCAPACLGMWLCAAALPESLHWWRLAAVAAVGAVCQLLSFEAIVLLRRTPPGAG